MIYDHLSCATAEGVLSVWTYWLTLGGGIWRGVIFASRAFWLELPGSELGEPDTVAPAPMEPTADSPQLSLWVFSSSYRRNCETTSLRICCASAIIIPHHAQYKDDGCDEESEGDIAEYVSYIFAEVITQNPKDTGDDNNDGCYDYT